MRSFFLLISSLLTLCSLNAQMPGGGGNRPGGGRSQLTGSFYGKILEAKTSKPIEYASVQLLQNRFDSVSKKRKEVVVTGMLTDNHGDFRLENVPAFGQLKLQVTILGYKPYEQTVSFDIKPGGDMSNIMSALDKDLGNIKIDIEEKTLDNVTVTSTNPGLRLGIDRKVFNVDKNMVSAGGTAVDVMRNVPSISVDIDGNVSMRNNTPQLFVDGRPTNLSLDQIPADAIESVEIITNPSAKFDASGGTAGILNVILKKNKRVGYSGSVRTNIDTRGRVGFGGDINIRKDKVNFFMNANMNQRKSISTGTTDRTTLIGTPNTAMHQVDESISKGNFLFFRSGFDFFLDNRNTLSIAGNLGQGRFKPTSESDIEIDSLYSPVKSSFSDRFSNSNSRFNHAGAMLSFKHLFPKQGEEWTADINYNRSKNNNLNLVSTNYYTDLLSPAISSFNQQQDGSGTNQNIVVQTDYVKPLTEKSKLEMGLRAQFRNVDNKNNFYIVGAGGTLTFVPDQSVNYTSIDNVYAAYTTYSNQIKNFGYQLGLRVESSDYEGQLPDKGQSFNINFPVSLFPSVFLNQKLKKDQDLQLNYSRKINRPNFFQLYPFTDYSDSLNISRGNPGLSPEFTNSLELSYQKTFKNRDNFIASLYYKNTTDLITRYQDKETNLSGKEVLINTYINASSSYVTGLELVSKNKMAKWWDMTSNLSLFTSKIKLNIAGQPEQDPFASWFLKINNTFKLPKNFTLQLSGEYTSKTILPPGGSGGGGGRGGGMFGGGGMGMFGQASASQGYVKANYYVDGGLRYEFLKNKQASLSLNVNDIFRTRRQNIFSQSAYFTQEVFRRRDPQIFRLNFNWRFGKFDPNLFKRKNNKNQDNGAEGMNMGQ
ncbi:MAG: TonB-dependent receptor [Chitinophagales bacterium]|nr:TonB-dependent receptor [Chitinophagales bacterium]